MAVARLADIDDQQTSGRATLADIEGLPGEEDVSQAVQSVPRPSPSTMRMELSGNPAGPLGGVIPGEVDVRHPQATAPPPTPGRVPTPKENIDQALRSVPRPKTPEMEMATTPA